MRLMTIALALALATPAFAADPYQGWTADQLKAKIGMLEKQIASLKGAGVSSAVAAAPAKAASANLAVDNFEGDSATVGGMWWTGANTAAASTIAPDPFVHEAGGAEGKFCGRVHGKLGANKDPWAWAAMSLALPNGDLRGYRAIEFWTKGDGKTHSVKLEKQSVTDFAHFSAPFTAPAKWTKVTIALADFKQAEWGKQVDHSMGDVEKLSFFPTSFDSTYDFSVDGITLLK